jgi:hypothetical protein
VMTFKPSLFDDVLSTIQLRDAARARGAAP